MLIDIVNLNSDASCLSSVRWFQMLSGGGDSELCQWLRLYTDSGKKISLGITGASLCDMLVLNSESVDIIKKHPEVFEVLLRPFSHDISPLRSIKGFAKNFEVGQKLLSAHFSKVSPYFLPPEFMLTNSQVAYLVDNGVKGTFVHPLRYSEQARQRIPDQVYELQGIFSKAMLCLPIKEESTQAYISALQNFEIEDWRECCLNSQVCVSWRDGESSFFIPQGKEREEEWLSLQGADYQRVFVEEYLKGAEVLTSDSIGAPLMNSYPAHSCLAWMQELRMLGYVSSLIKIESEIDSFTPQQLVTWLSAINSDILSSVEKNSPVVNLRLSPGVNEFKDFTIWRTDRNLEGEEYLSVLQESFSDRAVFERLPSVNSSAMKKLDLRIRCLLDHGII